MKSKTKIIITIVVVSSILFIGVFSFTFYSAYKYGERNGLLENDFSSSEQKEYHEQKDLIEEEQDRLELEEDLLEQQYINREISYEEYKNRKTALKRREEALDRQESKLERKYGEDD